MLFRLYFIYIVKQMQIFHRRRDADHAGMGAYLILVHPHTKLRVLSSRNIRVLHPYMY